MKTLKKITQLASLVLIASSTTLVGEDAQLTISHQSGGVSLSATEYVIGNSGSSTSIEFVGSGDVTPPECIRCEGTPEEETKDGIEDGEPTYEFELTGSFTQTGTSDTVSLDAGSLSSASESTAKLTKITQQFKLPEGEGWSWKDGGDGSVSNDSASSEFKVFVVLIPNNIVDLWWFDGNLTPQGAAQPKRSIQLDGLPSGESVEWSLSSGGDIVSITPTSEVKADYQSTGSSSSMDDVSIEAKFNGVVVADKSLTVFAPSDGSNLHIVDSGYVTISPLGNVIGGEYSSVHRYQIVDQFDAPAVSGIQINETFGPKIDYFPLTTWGYYGVTGGGTLGSGGQFDDKYGQSASILAVPMITLPGDPNAYYKVYGKEQTWYAGNSTVGAGIPCLNHEVVFCFGVARTR